MLKQKLVVSDASTTPMVFGLVRPVIVLPTQLLLTPKLTNKVLVHEACHIWRRDHWLGGLQLVVQTLFWFHPMVWLASREANRLCEICCDDDTLRLFDLPCKDYAQGLIDMLERQRDLAPIYGVPGIRPFEINKERIQRILNAGNRVRFRRRYFVFAFSLALIMFPAGGIEDWSIGVQRWSHAAEVEPDRISSIPKHPFTGDAMRQEMKFLVGSWSVQREDGKVVGRSTFTLERSGNMIREDWDSVDGWTAQGITYYDPNRQLWVLTWVDGSGTIMDSAGSWQGGVLRLKGLATKKDGSTFRVQTNLTKENESRVRMDTFANISGTFQRVSKVTYCRETPADQSNLANDAAAADD